MKIIVLGALPFSLINFRGALLKLFSTKKVTAVAMASNATDTEMCAIKKLGCDYIDYPVARNSLSPANDLQTLFSLYKIFKLEKPKFIFAYTIKPIIWGGIAAKFVKTSSFYALITGLGYAFQKGGIAKNCLNILVKNLYRIALSDSKAVIFQNRDNMKIFIREKIIPKEKCYLVNGSGVDLNQFPFTPIPKVPRFLLIARLLGDKGIREYVRAAKRVKQKYPKVIFELVGPKDSSPDGIQNHEIREWIKEGAIKYSGATKKVRSFIEKCSVYVLPSYHEGMPRTVLEAMAVGRPILTTDVPGCRETVVNDENGWLVEKANVEQLTERMIWFIENPKQWASMGKKSHAMVKDKFDVHKVNKDLLEIMGL